MTELERITEELEALIEPVKDTLQETKRDWQVGDFVYDPIYKKFGTIAEFKEFYFADRDVKLINCIDISYNTFRRDTMDDKTCAKYLKDANEYIEKEIKKLEDKITLYKQVKDNQ